MNQPGGGWTPPQPGQAFGQPAPAAPGQPAAPQQQPQQGFPQQPPQQGFPQQPPQQGFPQQQPPQQGYPQGAAPAQPDYAANPFAGLTSGDPETTRLPYLIDGDFLLQIDSLKFKQARSGKPLYIIETEVLESNNPQRPPGMKCSSFIDMGNVDTRGSHMASFISAVFGVDPRSVPANSPVAPWQDQQTGQQMPWQHYAEMSIHDSQPWTGVKVNVHVEKVKKRDGGDFTRHDWMPAGSLVVGAPAAAPAQAAPGFPAPGQTNWQPPPQGGGGNWGGPSQGG